MVFHRIGKSPDVLGPGLLIAGLLATWIGRDLSLGSHSELHASRGINSTAKIYPFTPINVYIYIYIYRLRQLSGHGFGEAPPPFHRALRDLRELPGLQGRPGPHQLQALRVEVQELLVELHDLLAQVR